MLSKLLATPELCTRLELWGVSLSSIVASKDRRRIHLLRLGKNLNLMSLKLNIDRIVAANGKR
jgi:hypothetical protein